MRVLEAAKLVRAEVFPAARLWLIATRPERVAVALILGRPDELPAEASTPDAAWRTMNGEQRRLVLRYAPPGIKARLPASPTAGRRMVWAGRMVAAGDVPAPVSSGSSSRGPAVLPAAAAAAA